MYGPGWDSRLGRCLFARQSKTPRSAKTHVRLKSGDWNAMGKQNWSTILMMALTAATLVGMVVLVIKFLSAVIHTSV